MTVKIGDEILWIAGPNSAGYSYLKVFKIENGIVYSDGFCDGEQIIQTQSEKNWEDFANKDGVIKR